MHTGNHSWFVDFNELVVDEGDDLVAGGTLHAAGAHKFCMIRFTGHDEDAVAMIEQILKWRSRKWAHDAQARGDEDTLPFA